MKKVIDCERVEVLKNVISNVFFIIIRFIIFSGVKKYSLKLYYWVSIIN